MLRQPHTVGWLRNPEIAPLGNHDELLFVGIYRGVIIGFVRWCEMDFVHPRYGVYMV